MNIEEILEFKRIITTSNLSDEQIRRLGEILENIIKGAKSDAIDEMLDAIGKEVAYSYKTLNYSKIEQIAEQLKEQK